MSPNKDKRGWRVLVTVGGRRATVRLGSHVTERQARTAADHVTALAAARRIGATPDTRTLAWLSDVGDGLRARLAALALCSPRVRTERYTLGVLIDRFGATVRVAPGTVAAYKQGLDSLAAHFGRDRELSSITPLDGDQWRRTMVDEGFAPATVSKRVQTGRNLFRRAVRWKMILESPLDELRAGRQDNAARQQFIDRTTIERVIEACPDAEWRLIVGLSRYAGLRCPSEHLALTWGDWDVSRGSLRVQAAKTNTVRQVPVCPELAVLLQAAFDQAEAGGTYIVARYRLRNCNLRTRLRKIIRRAGLDPWPRLFHNLRASAQSEWAERFPLASVCRWLGNTPAVAARHYLTARDEAFDAAVRGEVQNRGTPGGTVPHQQGPSGHSIDAAESRLQGPDAGCPVLMEKKMGAGGFEPP